MIPEYVAERVLTHVVMGPLGCHVSAYSVGSHGYAQVGWKGDDGRNVTTTAHRAAWVGVYGPDALPEEFTLDHVVCHFLRCVNVAHLRLLTQPQNAARTLGRDWPLDECVDGHKLAEHWRPAGPERGKGYCGACRAEARALRRELVAA